MQGSGVLFNPNGQKALEAIDADLLERFRSHSVQPNSYAVYDRKGNEITRSTFLGQGELHKQYGYGPFILGWHEIRQLIFDNLPPGTVEFNTQVASYDEDADGVTIHFDDGQPSVRAKLLIGADGYFSRIRKQCLDDGPPKFAGLVMWRARIPWQEGMPNNSVSYRDGLVPTRGNNAIYAMLFPLGTLEATSDTTWSWTLCAHVDKVKEAGVEFDAEARTLTSVQGIASSGSALQNVCKVFADFPRAIMDVVEGTDPTTVTQHGLYVRALDDTTPEQGWGRGRVSLLGDAAHATIPNGQGLCLAIEDAVVLGWHLRQHGCTTQALRSYEYEQVPRAKDVIAHGHDNASKEEKETFLYKPSFKPLWKTEDTAAVNGSDSSMKGPPRRQQCITMSLSLQTVGGRARASCMPARKLMSPSHAKGTALHKARLCSKISVHSNSCMRRQLMRSRGNVGMTGKC
ncbi:hypothetical protein ABBQ38_005577 [Trebouxia sp. C0009 RCD-2024]